MAAPRIVVVNPNSNAEVTAGLDRALAPLRFAGGPAIVCETLVEGPFGIESQADVEAVTLPLRRRVREEDAAAWVIACYSDPGLMVCREATERPVFGIAESGIMAAMQRGDHFGVVAIRRRSIPRHARQRRALAVESRLAGERPLELTVAELAHEGVTWGRLVDVGRELKDLDGADVLVLGCAGMARYRKRLEDKLDMPVVDPTEAAVTSAFGTVVLGAGDD